MKYNFSKLFITSTFCLTTLFNYSQTEEELRAAVWNNSSKEFSVKDIPEKWKNESAVVIASSSDYYTDFITKMQGLGVTRLNVTVSTFHRRIKLLDNAAVKEFSQFNFNSLKVNASMFGKAKEYFIVGIKVIKPDGTEKVVDLKSAVKTESGSEKDNKIAVPNLEVGDIIDYFSQVKDENYYVSVNETFFPYEEYPIMYTSKKIKLPKKLILESIGFNGAPTFKEGSDDENLIYTLELKDLENKSKYLWYYPYRSMPFIKYSSTSERIIKKTTGGLQEKLRYYSPYFGGYGYAVDAGIAVDYLKTNNFDAKTSQSELVREIFYLLRNPLYKTIYTDFKTVLFKLLDKYKINYETHIAPSRNVGTLSQVLNLRYEGFKPYFKILPNDGNPIYIDDIDYFTDLNLLNYNIETDTVLLYNKEDKENRFKILTDNKYPVSTYQQNKTLTEYQVDLNSDEELNLNIKRRVTSDGHNKLSNQELVVTQYDYFNEYKDPKFEIGKSALFRQVLKEYKKEKEKIEQRKQQDYNKRDENVKKSLESEHFTIADYKNFSLINMGIWYNRPSCEYKDEFTITNLVNKAGNNYLIQLPALLENQTEYNEEIEKDRKIDVHMNYARSFQYEIKFKIPDGYKIEGLETLNKKITSKYGSFEASSTIENNTLTIKTNKIYNTNYIPFNEWAQCKDFMNGAVDFTKQKVLLKKN